MTSLFIVIFNKVGQKVSEKMALSLRLTTNT